MPWKGSKGHEGGLASRKEMIRAKVDQLPLVTSSENADSATPSGDSESKSDSSSVAAIRRPPAADSRHVTTVTIRHLDDAKQLPVVKFVQNRRSIISPPPPPAHAPPPTPVSQHDPAVISYEKNKSVRITVREPGPDRTPGSKRGSRIRDGDDEKSFWPESASDRGRDVTSWVADTADEKTRSFVTCTEKVNDEEGVKVRPFLEASWKSCSHSSVLDEAPSSDDCQRSTSTLVNTNPSKIGKTSESQRGFISMLCGLSVVIGSAVCLRLPGLLLTFGPGSFLSAFGLCLLFVAIPLAYLESGLAQFSNNSVIGIWSLVPLSRGIGWSTVIGCLYWGATTAGLSAPWFHYLIAQNDPQVLQVPSICRLLNGSEFDAVNYYRHCVYNLSSDWDTGLDLSLTWSLPAGLVSILMFASISVAGGPLLLSLIAASGSLLAILGFGTQFYVAFAELTNQNGFRASLAPFIYLITPDPQILIKPQVWLAAMSQALLCLGPGVGLLLNHSANNVFRHPLKRHLWVLTIITILATLFVSMTTLLQTKIFTDQFSFPTNLLEDSGTVNDSSLQQYFSQDVVNETDSSSVWNMRNNCVLFSYDLEDFSCSSIPPGLVKGAPFILSSHLTEFAMGQYPFWLSSLLKNLIFLGFLGAGIATSCVCMHVGVVAAREARSLPPTVAALILMAVLSLVAAPMATQAGASLIHLMDHYVLTPGLLWPPVATLVALTACHGVTKIRKDMTFMLESVVSWFWLPIWALVLPLLLLGVSVWAFYFDWRDLCVLDGPEWMLAIVWSLRAGLLVAIPVTAVIVVNSQLAYGFKDKVLSSLQSSREWGDWGPQDPIEHHNWRRWREDETRSYASLERRLASKSRPLTYTHSTLSSSSSSTLAKLRAKYRGQNLQQACDL